MSKVIWHVGAWSNNYGDRVLQAANTSILRDRCEEDLQFVYVDTQKTYFSEQLITKMNAEADLLLIGGGGLIFHRPMDHSHSGWQFNIDLENIARIRVPIVVYGIGYNKFTHDEHIFPQAMWDSLQAMIHKADLFSVRNTGTHLTMKEHGVDTSNVAIMPDAGMFVKPDRFEHPCLDHKVKIGLNWATDRPEQRFGSYERSREALRETMLACKKIADKHDAKVYIIEHLMPNDLCGASKSDLHYEARQILGDRAYMLSDELDEELYPPFDYTAGFFADIYRQMDLVIGMRGHANIIPFGQNTPFIGIGAHNKVKWFMEDVGLGHCFVSLDNPQDMERLLELAENILEVPELYKKQLARALSTFSGEKDFFIDEIVRLL